LTQPNAPFWDFKWFYTAGQLVHEWINPYNSEVFAKAFCQYTKTCGEIPPFIYPPNALPPLWFLGFFSIETASAIWVGLHLMTIAVLVWSAIALLKTSSKSMWTTCAIACVLIHGVVFDLRVGNVSSFIAALVLGAVVFAKRDRQIPAGILLGLSTIKPTLSLLFFAYFLWKRRFTLVSTGIVTSVLLAILGLIIVQVSPLEFLAAYKAGVEWTFTNLHSNIPQISSGRIDFGVIGYRWFPNQPLLAGMISRTIIVGSIVSTIVYLYRNRNNQSIALSDASLIACLSISSTYSQAHGTAMLIFSVVFLLDRLIKQVEQEPFNLTRLFVWLIGIGCLAIHTGLIMFRVLEPLKSAWLSGALPYWFRVSIGSLPNYAILGLIIVTLYLAKPQSKST
ncbi:DUF2029 domain-containing protein, partial [Pseudanabaenaceae cyanobacterium LEGE 13415]|nr:DUF2029 domain-containing protein [Pseudanabaenaceae cyanobacterium LEGE 13415]